MMQEYYNQVKASERRSLNASSDNANEHMNEVAASGFFAHAPPNQHHLIISQDERQPLAAHRLHHRESSTGEAASPLVQVNASAHPRSKSDCRASSKKKEDFRLRMGDRMQKMRQQGRQVEGLAKLHAFFTKMH